MAERGDPLEHPSRFTSAGFVVAGLINVVGILTFTRAFTSDAFFRQDPAFSPEACGIIVLWGLAYASLGRAYHHAPWLVLLFAVEKAFFVVLWVRWLAAHRSRWSALWAEDVLAAVFFGAYGAVDLAVGAFFVWVFARVVRKD